MADNDDFKKFSEQYISSCKEQISALANNPAMLEKALEPFMKMQQEYLSNPENANFLTEKKAESNNTERNKDEDNTERNKDEESINVMLQKILHRIQGIRKKVLPEVMDKIEQIDLKIANIEKHLGITEASDKKAEAES